MKSKYDENVEKYGKAFADTAEMYGEDYAYREREYNNLNNQRPWSPLPPPRRPEPYAYRNKAPKETSSQMPATLFGGAVPSDVKPVARPVTERYAKNMEDYGKAFADTAEMYGEDYAYREREYNNLNNQRPWSPLPPPRRPEPYAYLRDEAAKETPSRSMTTTLFDTTGPTIVKPIAHKATVETLNPETYRP